MLYLLDTNAYLRLAKSIDPLLGAGFVAATDAIRITSECDTEWKNSNRLQTKFEWVGESQYSLNRSANTVKLTAKQMMAVRNARTVIQAFASGHGKQLKENRATVPSPADCLALAYVFALCEDGVPATVVTDDAGMHLIAKEFEISMVASLDLLSVMLHAKTRTTEEISALAKYLHYIDDLPQDWRTRGRRILGITLP